MIGLFYPWSVRFVFLQKTPLELETGSMLEHLPLPHFLQEVNRLIDPSAGCMVSSAGWVAM